MKIIWERIIKKLNIKEIIIFNLTNFFMDWIHELLINKIKLKNSYLNQKIYN